jgi:ribonuclease-3
MHAAAMTRSLENALGHRFSDPSLLEQALTHRSVEAAERQDYERLEFLGDRVLALVVTEMLMQSFPTEREGSLAKRLAALVRQETLAAVSREIGLGAHVRLSRGEAEGGGRENETILADVCEAVIAAIYRDGSLAAARLFIERYWRERVLAGDAPPQDAKTTLQEWAQGRGLALPSYVVVARVGPDHAPAFTVRVAIAGGPSAEGEGPSKRVAEQAAAQRALESIAK